MKFKKLDTLEGVELSAIQASLAEALAEYGALTGIADDDLSDEQLEDMLALSDAVEELQAAEAALVAASTERSDKAKAARDKLNAAKEAADAAAAEGEGDEGEGDGDGEGDEGAGDAENLDAELEALVDGELEGAGAVTASAGRTRGVTKSVSGSSNTAKNRPAPTGPKLAPIIASGGYGSYQPGQKLEDTLEMSKAFIARLKGMPTTKGRDKRTDKFSVATIEKHSDFKIDTLHDSSEKIYETLMAARNSKQRFGKGITAAGGWGSPSQIVYDMCVLETVSGILDMPEVTADHGGINYTKGPDFSAIFSSSSFLQTEAQAIAGTTKVFADIILPSFQDVRLDAIGYGVRAPLLTKAAWPELVNRFLQGTLVAHAHRVNASKIARIVTALGTAVVGAHIGSSTSDALAALDMQAQRLRSKYMLDPNATIEGFAPTWLVSIFKQDLSYRSGIGGNDSWMAITQAEVDSWLASRNIKLQYVYDWQQLAATGVAWPATAQVGLYTEGAFVALTSDVISLDAVYDTTATGLPVNSFLAAFYEEGLAVFNPCGSGTLLTLDTAHYAGRVGAADVTIA